MKKINLYILFVKLFYTEVKIIYKKGEKMSYVHCHNCGWDNGDFLEDMGGTKAYLKNFVTSEFKNLVTLWYARKFTNDRLGRHCRSIINAFKSLWVLVYFYHYKQDYKTTSDFENKNPHHVCPSCGEFALDID